MKIYLLEEKRSGYAPSDYYDSFVVVARDSRQARRQPNNGNLYGPGKPEWMRRPVEEGRWLNPKKTSCREIGKARADAEAGVVVGSFNAG